MHIENNIDGYKQVKAVFVDVNSDVIDIALKGGGMVSGELPEILPFVEGILMYSQTGGDVEIHEVKAKRTLSREQYEKELKDRGVKRRRMSADKRELLQKLSKKLGHERHSMSKEDIDNLRVRLKEKFDQRNIIQNEEEKMSEIKQGLKDLDEGWIYFGKKKFECPGAAYDKKFYINNKQLPEPCCRCYKALIFWDGTADSSKKFFNMIGSFDINYRGKINNRVVVFYFMDKNEMMEFMEYLKNKINEFDLKGKIEWRRACKLFQDMLPELWKNAKEFIPDKCSTLG